MNSIVYVVGAVVIIGVVLKMLIGSGSVPNGAELRRVTVPQRSLCGGRWRL